MYKLIFGLFEMLYIVGIVITFFVMLAGSDDPNHSEKMLHMLISSVFLVFFVSCVILLSAVFGKTTKSRIRLGIIGIVIPVIVLAVAAILNAIG